jgi:uncharacterized protein
MPCLLKSPVILGIDLMLNDHFLKFKQTLINLPRRTLSAVVLVYRYTFGVMIPPRCRYYPSCSQYALEALKGHGAIKGAVLAGWRILRCNPFSLGGLDSVPDRFHIKCCGRAWPRYE